MYVKEYFIKKYSLNHKSKRIFIKKFGFTLAEIMIVLTVIGIITAVILPVAIHSKPDENVMKFKKAHNTLYKTIGELINSDKYYLNGDLGKFPNGQNIDYSINTSYATYFCNTIADVVSAKKVNCSKYFTKRNSEAFYCSDWQDTGIIDKQCKEQAKNIGEEIKLSDNVIFYQIAPAMTFAYSKGYINVAGFAVGALETEDFSDSKGSTFYFPSYTKGEAYRCSKVFCIDIDGIPSTGSDNCNDREDICPFGYGIRVDGKITLGKRATEWLEKSIQGEL